MRNILTRTFISCLLIIGALIFCAAQILAQDSATSKIHVIPRPQQLKVTQEQFRLGPTTIVALADPRSEDDRFAAQDFIDDLKETSGILLKIGKVRKQSILIGLLEQPAIQAAFKRAGLLILIPKVTC